MVNTEQYTDSFELSDRDYNRLAKIVYNCAGINLGDNKKELVHARLSKILRLRKIGGFNEYIKILGNDESGNELISLLDAISTNVTHFFRESAHFNFITDQFVNYTSPTELQFWSAGCSSGEEPYSIAITLKEHFGNTVAHMPKILSTDISTKVLGKAKAGVYPSKAINNLDKALLKKYFLKGKGNADGHIKVKNEITDMVMFQRLNLIEPFSFDIKFNIIFCRNVMIYFDNQTRRRIVENFHKCLKTGGYLIIGHSESLNGIEHSYKYIKPTIYEKAK